MSGRMSAKRFRPVAATISVAVLALIVSPSGAQQRIETRAKEPDEATKSTQQLLNDYMNENRDLKLRVKQLEREVQQLRQLRALKVVPAPGAPNAIPPNWQPRDYNGIKYYVVPLEEAKPGTSAAGVEVKVEPKTRESTSRPATGPR